jgi:hypothetical protein
MAIKARFDDARENPSGPVLMTVIDSLPEITRIVATINNNIDTQTSEIARFLIMPAVYFFR